jgi:hypothetical protein
MALATAMRGKKKSYDIRHNGFISLADESDKTRDTTLERIASSSLCREHITPEQLP